MLIIAPRVLGDRRGLFVGTWSAASFAAAGLDPTFVQDNHSRSQRGVLRGLHFQNPGAQGKLVRVTNGAVFDVAVDLRAASPTFGQWIGVELNGDNQRMVWGPEGFAHGLLTLEVDTDVLFRCTAPYSRQSEHMLARDDPDIGIDWPVSGLDLVVSEKDKHGLSLANVAVFQ